MFEAMNATQRQLITKDVKLNESIDLRKCDPNGQNAGSFNLIYSEYMNDEIQECTETFATFDAIFKSSKHTTEILSALKV